MSARTLGEQLKIQTPCSASWDEMIGNEWVRFCEHCQLTVNDLTPLTPKRVRKLIAASKGRLCVRYRLDREGLPLIKNVPQQLHQIRKRVSKIAAGAFTATLSLSSVVSQPTNQAFSQPVAMKKFDLGLGAITIGSSIKGHVTDPAGMLIPGASVLLGRSDGPYLHSSSSNDEGQFAFEGLEPGSYHMKVDATGFASKEISNIVVAANETQEVRPSLEIAAIEVEVTAYSTQEVVIQGGALLVLPEHPLIRAAHDDDLEALVALLTRENANLRDESTGSTALEYAVRHGNHEMLRLLLSTGADVNSRDSSQQTSLMLLGEKATADMVWDLIHAGAKIELKDEEGDTALIEAAGESNQQVVMALLHAGAKIDVKNEEGQTALMMAAHYEQAANIRALVRAGVDINARDKKGRTALDYAIESNNEKTIKLLQSYGALKGEPAVEAEDVAYDGKPSS